VFNAHNNETLAAIHGGNEWWKCNKKSLIWLNTNYFTADGEAN
jgi:hypothetical protein